jgi:hypothetical protein
MMDDLDELPQLFRGRTLGYAYDLGGWFWRDPGANGAVGPAHRIEILSLYYLIARWLVQNPT